MNYLNKFLARVSVLPVLLMPTVAGAAPIAPPKGTEVGNTGLSKAGDVLDEVAPANASDLPQDLVPLIGRLISGILGVLGIFFVILVLYAGYLWMTAGGEEDKVKKSKNLLGQAVIGLVIIVAAYAISRFVIELVVKAGTA